LPLIYFKVRKVAAVFDLLQDPVFYITEHEVNVAEEQLL
jgi:hypothetical protein